MSQCIAKANVLRCGACFAFPVIAVAAYAYKVSAVGDDIQSYMSRVGTGGLPLVSALLVFGGCVVWALITWPKAWTALRYRDCAISLSESQLKVYGDKLERGEIASLDTVKRAFDLLLRIRRTDGSILARSIVLLSPSPELIIKRLQGAGY